MVKVDPERLRWRACEHEHGYYVVFLDDRGVGLAMPDEATARLIAAIPPMLRFFAACMRPNGPLAIDVNRLLSICDIEIVKDDDRGD